MKYYIGIDIGTSSAKLLLVDERGNVRKESSEEYFVSEPKAGWKEIDPNVWMQALDVAMERLLDKVETNQVRAIGVTGQMHTTVFLDKDGNSIRPSLMWNDTRTADIVKTMKQNIKINDEISYICDILSTGSPAANLFWLQQNEPEHFEKIHKFLIGPDYIVYRLTGQYGTDFCEASTSSLCDLRRKNWSEQMRQLFVFPKEIYPTIRGSAMVVGTLKKEVARKYKLSSDVKVVAGTGDNPAAAVATGCFFEKKPVLSLGTSGVLMFPKESVQFPLKGKHILFSFDEEDIMVLVQGVVQSCGSSMDWWMRQILHTKDYKEETLVENIDEMGQNSLLFYPHLVGEKTIYANPNLRGGFFGIGTDTTRRDMTIAVMEGISFGVKQLTEIMNVPREKLSDLKVMGGGAKNEIWLQILADVLDTSVVQVEGTSGAGYGAALLAMCAIEEQYKNRSEDNTTDKNNNTAENNIGNKQSETDFDTRCESIQQMYRLTQENVKTNKTFYPIKQHVERYEEKYKKYKKIYEALEQVFSE